MTPRTVFTLSLLHITIDFCITRRVHHFFLFSSLHQSARTHSENRYVVCRDSEHCALEDLKASDTLERGRGGGYRTGRGNWIRGEMFEIVRGDCEILNLWVFRLEKIGRVPSLSHLFVGLTARRVASNSD